MSEAPRPRPGRPRRRTPRTVYDEAMTHPVTSVYRTNLLLEALVLSALSTPKNRKDQS